MNTENRGQAAIENHNLYGFFDLLYKVNARNQKKKRDANKESKGKNDINATKEIVVKKM